METKTIPPKSGTAFGMQKGQLLKVICPEGEQVSDMMVYHKEDISEQLSNGKTFDYEETLMLTKGNFLYSNYSNRMLEIVEDTCGTHDFLLAPCCPTTMSHFYGLEGENPNCRDNLFNAFKAYGISQITIPTAFNIFMNVDFSNPKKISVLPPVARPGDYIVFKAHMNVIIGLTACSAADSNGGTFSAIDYVLYE